MITGKELRQLFREFFEQRDHTPVSSSPLIPPDDPTLLFTSAGMVQFKSLWAGQVDPLPYKRAVTIQKCFRAGGKGSDLENVGKTLRHLTFFEMLGNFSFGDYFKREAIQWGWEFTTEVLNIPAERLYASVYKDDEEAFKIWEQEIGLPADRIVPLGDEDNFWGPAGDTGACGPCSELYLDMGEERGCGKPGCTVGCDCERYLEFWNMVFPQFDQQLDGTRLPLKNRGIDTGMGLERLACIVQDNDTLFETDLMFPIIKAATEILGVEYSRDRTSTLSYNVIADHIRGLVFVLSEGVVPSNEGRGYVLRRVLRRAVRHYKKLGFDEPCLHRLVDVVIDTMGDEYPEIKSHPDQVKKVIRLEEERFHRTLSQGIDLLEEIISGVKKAGQNVIPGEQVFQLYDTYGFPVILTREIAEESGLAIDEDKFKKCLEDQKCMARAAWKGARTYEKLENSLKDILEEYGGTRFTGYDEIESLANLIAIMDENNSRVESIGTGEDIRLVLDETPFYGEAGGQVGDTGDITLDNARFEVTETQRTPCGLIIHIGNVAQGEFNTGTIVKAVVDSERRYAIMRHHTVTHLLQGALKRIVGTHITQSGSLVHPDHMRFDFTHVEALTPEQIYRIERLVNQKIMEDIPVKVMELPREQAREMGAIAPFGEKYGHIVRVVKIGDYSMEFCGGTHLDRTGKIGAFVITNETSIAAGVRRIEARAGMPAFEYMHHERSILHTIAQHFTAPTEEVIERVETLSGEVKELRRELQRLKQDKVTGEIDTILQSAETISGVTVVTYKFENLGNEQLRNLADMLQAKIKENVIILLASVNTDKDKVQLICSVSEKLTSRYPANTLIKAVAREVGGGGGGRPDMAQAGGKRPGNIDAAFKTLTALIKEK